MSNAHIIMDEIMAKVKENPSDIISALKYIDGSATDYLMRTECREEGRRDAKKPRRRDDAQ
jgi:hypothetical protein